jgi:hypothetical protein
MRASEFASIVPNAVAEASYPGNIGIMEVARFFQTATDDEKSQFRRLVAQGDQRQAWQLIQQVTGVQLQGQQFREPEPMDENFHDGRKPGRKGLARRMGVDCSKSVSELRRTAKNSSGERQRMAHWCGNMKSGRQKKNK